MRRSLLLVSLVSFACGTSNEPPRSAGVAPPTSALPAPPAAPPASETRDAGSEAGSPATSPRSPFVLIAHTGAPLGMMVPRYADSLGYPLPQVTRNADHSVTLAAEYARLTLAPAGSPVGAAPEPVYVASGLEHHAFVQHLSTSSAGDAVRWVGGRFPDEVWANLETEYERAGPGLSLYKLTRGRWSLAKPRTGYLSPVWRGDELYAVESVIKDVPETKGSPGYSTIGSSRIVRLLGKSPGGATVRTEGCVSSFSGAEDGTLLALEHVCGKEQRFMEVLARNAPPARVALGGDDSAEVSAVVSADLAYAGGTALFRVRKAATGYAVDRLPLPKSHSAILAMSVATDGRVYLVADREDASGSDLLLFEKGEIQIVPMPVVPPMPIVPEDLGYTMDLVSPGAYVETFQPREPEPPEAATPARALPLAVDARGDEVLVTALGPSGLALLSTKPHGAVGVLPPAHAQRLHLVRTAPRAYVARPSACKLPVASLVLDKDVDAVALRKALEANNLSGQVGMAELEGQVRTVLTAITRDEVASAMAKLPSARGKVVCGRVAIDRWVE